MSERLYRQSSGPVLSGVPAHDTPAGSPKLRVVGTCHVRLWGLECRERLERAFRRHGVVPVAAAGSGQDSAQGAADGGVIFVGAGWEISPSVVAPLVSRPGLVLMGDAPDESPARVAAVHLGAGASSADRGLAESLIGRAAPDAAVVSTLRLTVSDGTALARHYDEMLRKRTRPYVMSVLETPLRDIEWRTFDGAYKGVTDFVTKWIWPRLALPVTAKAAEWNVTPNMVTTISLVLAVVVTIQFWHGYFLSGLAGAWLMTFLDTVDGKLARVTMTSTKWGEVYDHGIDLIHPPFWWAAWWVGLSGATTAAERPELLIALWVVVGGYVLGRVVEGLFSLFFAFEIHVWRPMDSHMRLITARRNPNLVLLTVAALVQRPEAGFMLVAGWTVVCLAFHVARLCWALVLAASGRKPDSWLFAPAADGWRAS